MTLFVTEHAQSLRVARQGTAMTLPPLASYALTSASTNQSIAALAYGGYVRVSADQGMFMTISTSSAPGTLSSTNAFRIPPNAPPELFSLPNAARFIVAQST